MRLIQRNVGIQAVVFQCYSVGKRRASYLFIYFFEKEKYPDQFFFGGDPKCTDGLSWGRGRGEGTQGRQGPCLEIGVSIILLQVSSLRVHQPSLLCSGSHPPQCCDTLIHSPSCCADPNHHITHCYFVTVISLQLGIIMQISDRQISYT